MSRPGATENEAGLLRLTEAIEKLTLERESVLHKETADRRQFLLTEAKKRIADDYDQNFAEGRADLLEGFSSQRSLQVNQLRRQLFIQRREYAKRVFADASAKLSSFAAGDEYLEFMYSLARDITSAWDCSAAEVRLRSKDLPLQSRLADIFPADCCYTGDEAIVTGGMMVWIPQRNYLIDERLETRLQSEQRWFFEHSGMQILW